MFKLIVAIRMALVVAAAAVFVTAGIISAQTPPNQEEQVRNASTRLVQSINGGDVSAAMTSLDSAAVFVGYGFCPGERCVGPASIRAALESSATENVRLQSVSGMERVLGEVWISEVEL